MVCMVLTPFSDVMLGVWYVWLSGPSNNIAHILHDGYNFHRFYVEIVFRQPRVVNRCCRAVVRLGHLTTKWMPSVSCRSSCWHGVGVQVAIARTPICRLEGSLGMPFLTPAIICWELDVVKLIFLPSDLYPCLG